jgi:hypothetical protein
MKKALLLLLLLTGALASAQNINNYQYLVIPEKFDFQKQKGQYDLNNLSKKMFEKYGFTTFMENTSMPDELALDRCKALYADIVESGMMNTNLTIVLKDCSGTTVFTSAAGRSKEKDRKKAYYEALREASLSLQGLNYSYSGNSVTVSKPVTKTETVNIYVPSNAAAPQQGGDNVLFANPTAYGYELLDKGKKSVLKMYKTSQPDYYSAKMETRTGVVFKKGDQWVFEYYTDDKPVSEKLNIKF